MATVALRPLLFNRVSWAALFAGFFFGFGGRAGVPRDRMIVGREETVPAPGAPLSPQRA